MGGGEKSSKEWIGGHKGELKGEGGWMQASRERGGGLKGELNGERGCIRVDIVGYP